MLEIACTFLVDSSGALLLQLRDDKAPYYPNVWGLPGGAVEPGETPLPFTPGSAEVIEQFLTSPAYAALRR